MDIEGLFDNSPLEVSSGIVGAGVKTLTIDDLNVPANKTCKTTVRPSHLIGQEDFI